MKKFLFGAVSAIVLLVLGGLATALLGLINTDADRGPGRTETWLANQAMDASMQRHAPMTAIRCPRPTPTSSTA